MLFRVYRGSHGSVLKGCISGLPVQVYAFVVFLLRGFSLQMSRASGFFHRIL